MASPSTSLSVTVAHAISYLTRGLAASYSQASIARLQLVLEANLMAHYAPSWVPTEPLRGSGRRCFTLSPNALPPRPIHNACMSANVKWSDWIAALGGVEFDLFVDPGCVSVRFAGAQGAATKFFTVWSEEVDAEQKLQAQKAAAEARLRANLDAHAALRSRTFAQQLLQHDEDEENELFARIAQEVHEPTFKTPTVDRFPPTLSLNQSRRERARQQRVFIDSTRKEVTPYDGGKTTVLTGGVMLGAKPAASSHRKTGSSASASWRAIRA
ncbi:hypothetical protein PUNSTDRAFT_94796 [Punctularia strigosozonata HHB-11173 SS5]|uniref:uncharacterized protein n=1 Tax=Punctularia strigosozonata (strain HHB-11173) TaxID=741275 RepID=UPI000441671A|nr:uncharacterized protein PUNSTDRAFT_94796 [Punctularia strigosozonata HHB-11173 SS5]EIN13616.1 hypothetical protein PUNSTDRAFT_94796 [Punctularia strigosozonata HHB-11173 SS5]